MNRREFLASVVGAVPLERLGSGLSSTQEVVALRMGDAKVWSTRTSVLVDWGFELLRTKPGKYDGLCLGRRRIALLPL